jgi:AraC-like DNA-binding protein
MARGHFGAGKAGLTPGLRSMRAVSTPADSRLTPQHTVAVQQLHGVLQGAQHRGLALPPLLLRAGIPPSLLEAPQARVSQRQYASLLRVLRRVLRDELWGLTSRPLPPGSFALCAQRLVHARTLEQALREGFGFYHLLLADFTPRLERDGTLARVRIMRRAPFNPRLDYAQKAFMLFCFGFASWLVARRVPLVGVDYTQPLPAGSESSRVYQAPIRQGQPHIGLRFEARWLELPVVQSPQSLREFLGQAPANLLVTYRDGASTSERVRRLLRRHLGGEMPPLEAVAAQLQSTPQTLRRRLRAEGRAYQQLKDDLRRDAAISLLAQPALSLIEVANRVGFSEASTFHRAFKHWTGVAPGEYRQVHMNHPGPARSG